MKQVGIYFLLFTSILLRAQDTIYTRYGEVINAKVLEVGVEQVKYKKTNNPDGPSYAVLKSDVTLIQYLNGTKDLFPVPEFDNEGTIPGNNNSQQEQNEDLSDALRIVVNTLPFFTYTNWAWGWGWNSQWAYSRPLFRGKHHHHSHHNHSGHYGRRR